jgi:hypothetical protein
MNKTKKNNYRRGDEYEYLLEGGADEAAEGADKPEE